MPTYRPHTKVCGFSFINNAGCNSPPDCCDARTIPGLPRKTGDANIQPAHESVRFFFFRYSRGRVPRPGGKRWPLCTDFGESVDARSRDGQPIPYNVWLRSYHCRRPADGAVTTEHTGRERIWRSLFDCKRIAKNIVLALDKK